MSSLIYLRLLTFDNQMVTKNNFTEIDILITSAGEASESIQELITTIKTQPTAQPTTILIYGAPGTEKSRIAEFIHTNLKNEGDRLLILNCFHLTGSKIKRELTAYLDQLSCGQDQTDSTTTLLIHKIDQLKSSVQSQLSTIIQTATTENDLRDKPLQIMATIDSQPEQSKKEIGINKKLHRCFYGHRLTIPSLLERKEDLPLILKTLSHFYCCKYDKKQIKFSAHCTAFLKDYPWRGNIRELKKLIKYLVLHHSGKKISIQDLPVHFHNRNAHQHPWSNHHMVPKWERERVDFRQLIDQFETELIVTAMQKCGGNTMEAARLLNLKRTTLVEKIKKKEIKYLWQE